MQGPGEGFLLEGGVLQRLLKSLPELRGILVRRLGIRLLELAQNAACNRLHSVKQRVARWLLAVHDRIDSDIVRTTHDFLAKMIATDRPSVSIARSFDETHWSGRLANATQHSSDSTASWAYSKQLRRESD